MLILDLIVFSVQNNAKVQNIFEIINILYEINNIFMRVLVNWIVQCKKWTTVFWKFGTHYAYS